MSEEHEVFTHARVSTHVGRVITVLALGVVLSAADSPRQSSAASRYMAWRMGSELSTSLLLYSKGLSREQFKARQTRIADALSYFGAEIPPPPIRTGTDADLGRLLSYVAQSLVPTVTKNLHGDDLLLFEFALKSNLELWTYGPQDDYGRAVGQMVRDRADRLHLPPSTWGLFVDRLDAHATYNDVRAALVQMHDGVTRALSVAMTPEGAISETDVERQERESLGFLWAQEEANRLWITPVVAALKRATRENAAMQTLLSQLRFTATRHLARPANAYATLTKDDGIGTVEIDLGWLREVMSSASVEAFDLIDPGGDRGLVQRALQDHELAVASALNNGVSQPNFVLAVSHYVTDPFERAFVEAFSQHLTNEAMAWTMLHELGHHQLKHLSRAEVDVPAKRQRQLELDADAWASKMMLELGMPLHGVQVLMDMMVAIENAQSNTGLLPPEEASAHPSWRRRRQQLESAHDTLAATAGDWMVFRTVVNVAGAGHEPKIENIGYFFPRDPSRFGLCIGTAGVPGDPNGTVAVERTGQTIHIYKAAVTELADLHVLEPARSVTKIVTTITNRVTGKQTVGGVIAWQEPMSFEPQFGEVLSPKVFYRKALDQSVRDGRVRNAAMMSFEQKLRVQCEAAIDFEKGRLSIDEKEIRSEAAAGAHTIALMSLLSEDDYARLQARLHEFDR